MVIGQSLQLFVSSTNMQDLIDKTHSHHFEMYRRHRLEAMGFSDRDGVKKQMSMQETYDIGSQEFMKDLQAEKNK